MAIFGKVDADLLLITQLMQVNLGDAAELERFWYRTLGLAQMERITSAAFDGPDSNVDADGFLVTIDGKPWQWKDPTEIVAAAEAFAASRTDNNKTFVLDQFREVCKAARTIVLLLGATRVVQQQKLEWLRAHYGSTGRLEPKQNVKENTGSENADRAQIPLANYVPTNALALQNPPFFVASQIEALLNDLWRQNVILLACAECKNLFVTSRESQTFCSHRCADRVAKRRARRKKKEDGPSFDESEA